MLSYGTLLRNRWFTRVWVVQEHVLCNRQTEPCVLIGRATFSFPTLYIFTTVLQQLVIQQAELASKDELRLAMHSSLDKAEAALGFINIRAHTASSEFQNLSAANRLLFLLTHIGSKQATVPHDQFYGLFGLIAFQDLPKALLPDYRQPFEEVYANYTHYIIENTQDLQILAFSEAIDLPDQPSWVMDFRSQFIGRTPATAHRG
jgi:hypothetical protein